MAMHGRRPRKILQNRAELLTYETVSEALHVASAIPAGRVSLIKASYHAGMKPVAIARTLRVSLSIVNKVLSTESKARR